MRQSLCFYVHPRLLLQSNRCKNPAVAGVSLPRLLRMHRAPSETWKFSFIGGRMTEDLFLNELAEEFTQRMREGKLPDVEEFANRYPQLASCIRKLLSTLVLIEEAAAAKRNVPSDRTSEERPQPESPKGGTLPKSALVREEKI
jgi:hypothetical protein